MTEISNRNFGLLIAHLLPGFVALWGLQAVSPTVVVWLSAASTSEVPTIGGFLYVTLASVALGMTIGAIRWCLIDTIHHATGLSRPTWDDAKLQANLQAFDLLVEHHYRYYQFYANTLVALLIAYAAHRWKDRFHDFDGIREACLCLLAIVFFAASRNSLDRYYSRAARLMRTLPPIGPDTMTNGSHPHREPNPVKKPKAEKPPKAKPKPNPNKK